MANSSTPLTALFDAVKTRQNNETNVRKVQGDLPAKIQWLEETADFMLGRNLVTLHVYISAHL